MEQHFPTALVLCTTTATVYVVNIVKCLSEGNRPDGWKYLLSIVVSTAFAAAWRYDVIGVLKVQSTGDPVQWSWFGIALTGLLLAAVASEIAYPALKALRGTAESLNGGH
ncbi:MAG TPA: hypothetical protein VM537_04555 [Anaerolineae bacterium]|nr:hypothetical protein [Anaerolineae bacterium]